MTFFYIFLGIILFFVILLCCPMFVHISFRDDLKLKVKFLFFSFDLFSSKEPEKLEKNSDFAENGGKGNSNLAKDRFFSIMKERGFFGFLKILKQVVDVLFSSAKKVLKKIHINSFDLHLLVANNNAAETAINYGKVYALVSYAKSVLLRNVDESKFYIEVIPGFNEFESKVDFSSKIYFFPISMLGVVLGSLYKFIKNVFFSANFERV